MLSESQGFNSTVSYLIWNDQGNCRSLDWPGTNANGFYHLMQFKGGFHFSQGHVFTHLEKGQNQVFLNIPTIAIAYLQFHKIFLPVNNFESSIRHDLKYDKIITC